MSQAFGGCQRRRVHGGGRGIATGRHFWRTSLSAEMPAHSERHLAGNNQAAILVAHHRVESTPCHQGRLTIQPGRLGRTT